MTALIWFRQDLRIEDNLALIKACYHHKEVICLYVNDEQCPFILGDAQKWWLHHSLKALKEKLNIHGLSLCFRKGASDSILCSIVKEHPISDVYWNICYEPKQMQRDRQIKKTLDAENIKVHRFNSSLLHEPCFLKNKQGSYYKVFTSFWKSCLKELDIPPMMSIDHWPVGVDIKSDSLDDWKLLPNHPNWAEGFANYWQPGELGAKKKLYEFIENKVDQYKLMRNYPSKQNTSLLAPHLRFGEIGPRQVYRALQEAVAADNKSESNVETYLSEIGWREFSYYLLFHFPELPEKNFQSKFNNFPWEDSPKKLKQWQKGLTGYPIVDAGMRELWKTGYMHNRVRMIVASFLTKDLFIDWRKGARWFEDTLLDADLANNSAGWQWVAGSGADAAPYFRIFNPVLQGEKFDPEGSYVKQWVPELKNLPKKWIHQPWEAPKEFKKTLNYPEPIVLHKKARELALEYYKNLS